MFTGLRMGFRILIRYRSLVGVAVPIPYRAFLCDVSDSLEPVVGHSYPRLRQLILDVPPTELSKVSFLPGQWVDFWPAGFEQPCGFSISSEPHMLPQMELAIKQSPHPIVEWIHSDKCSENQIVKKPVQI